MNYGALISEAFWLTWRNRFLWVFGFFLGGGQIFNLIQNANNFSAQRPPLVGDYLGEETLLTIFEARRFVLDNLVLFLILAAVLVLAGIFVSLTSQGALVDGVAALHRGEERRFSSAFRAGLSNFWRVLGFALLFVLVSLMVGFLIVLLAILLFLGTIITADSLSARILVIILAVLVVIGLLIFVLIPLSIMWQLGLRALVADGRGVGESFGRGYDLVRQRPGTSLLVWLVGGALAFGASIALLILALLLGLLLAVPALILSAAGLSTASIVAGVVAGVVLLIALVIASAAVATFSHAYWTLAYLQLTAAEGEARPEQ